MKSYITVAKEHRIEYIVENPALSPPRFPAKRKKKRRPVSPASTRSFGTPRIIVRLTP